MFRLSPNIELLFTEAGPSHADRIRAAAAAGFDAVEMWPFDDKDVPSLRAALDETGVELTSQLAGPRVQFLLDPDHSEFYRGLDAGVRVARELGCPRMVVGSGAGHAGRPRQGQLEELATIYRRGIDHIEGSGVCLMVEAVNIRVDHPGALLDRTADAVWIARQVGSARFGVLYDLYHSTVEGEDVADEVRAGLDVIHYVQFADHPGRGEPGSGRIDWPARLDDLASAGYSGVIGLECYTDRPSAEALAHIQSLVAESAR